MVYIEIPINQYKKGKIKEYLLFKYHKGKEERYKLMKIIINTRMFYIVKAFIMILIII